MMRRKSLLSGIIILTLLVSMIPFAFTAAAETGKTEDYVKIGLKYGSSAPSAFKISANSGLILCSAENGMLEKIDDTLDGYKAVILQNGGSYVKITDASGNPLLSIPGDGTRCIAAKNIFTENETLTAGDSTYRGAILPYLNASGKMNIINYVNQEDYLRGVLGAEMSSSYELEALKAQAVAARSYLKENESKHKDQGFGVCATSDCQVYGGVAKESASTDQAVAETAGKMIYYNGAVVAGYFFANSGGHTQNSEDVWSSALGYLRGKTDPYSPESTWTVKLTKKELTTALASQGIGDVKSVSIGSVNDAGYVSSLTIVGSSSSVTKTKESIRSAFGSSTYLKSRKFTLSTEGGTIAEGSTSVVPASGTWNARGASGLSLLGETVTVSSIVGTQKINLNGMVVLGANSVRNVLNYTPQQTYASAAGSTVTLSKDSDTLILSGMGYGHGVGMSQTGANEMAKQGLDYLTILQYYYTDIEVK